MEFYTRISISSIALKSYKLMSILNPKLASISIKYILYKMIHAETLMLIGIINWKFILKFPLLSDFLIKKLVTL